MTVDDYRFERLSTVNLHNLKNLYLACFGIKTDLSFLKKKYETTVFGLQYIGYFAIHDKSNEIAGYYGVFPILAQIANKKILIAQSGDTMTHPNHQGKGLFTALAKMTYDLAKNSNVEFVFGFPNKNSYPGFIKKLNWKHNSDINNYTIKCSRLPFDKLAKKWPLFATIYRIFIEKKLSKYRTHNSFENSLSQQFPDKGFIIHDENFFNYKTYYKSYLIEINNIKCIIKIDGRMWVGDIEYCDDKAFLTLLEELKKIAKKIGCSSLQFSFFNNSTYDALIQQKHEVAGKNPLGVLNLSEAFEPNNFAFQAIDFDTY